MFVYDWVPEVTPQYQWRNWKIDSPSTPKSAFCVGSELIFGVGSEFLVLGVRWCWKWVDFWCWKWVVNRQTRTDTDRDRQRQTETDRHRQRQTETDRDRHGQTRTDTDRDRQRQTETDRDRHGQTRTDTDRHGQRQTETDTDRHGQTRTDTDRDRQRQTETDRDRHGQTRTDTNRDRQRQTRTDTDRHEQRQRQTETDTDRHGQTRTETDRVTSWWMQGMKPYLCDCETIYWTIGVFNLSGMALITVQGHHKQILDAPCTQDVEGQFLVRERDSSTKICWTTVGCRHGGSSSLLRTVGCWLAQVSMISCECVWLATF